jgi:hypothetical protein
MPDAQREAALGDAEEEFGRRVEQDGIAEARRWYRRQVMRSVPAALGHRLGAVGTAGRTERKVERMGAWMKDFELAFRALARRPGFTGTVLITLALGVGATTALFGIYRTVFLEPIPLPDSDRLIVVMTQRGEDGCCGPASGPDYIDWVERNRSFEALALLDPGSYTLTGMPEPERVFGTAVTANVFPMLGVAPVMGRTLLPEDEEAEGAVLVSFPFWQNQLGGRSDVVNSTLELDGRPYTIVGVMPEGFDVPSPWSQYGAHRLYMPFQRERLLKGDRAGHSWPVIGRLAANATKESAQADMERVTRGLAEEYPQTNTDWNAKLFTVHEYLFGAVGGQLRLILGAAALVLLIACGNVAGLLLARAATRDTELSVRAALGASRRAMVRLLFSEALLLALAGGVLGMLFSYVAIGGFKALLPRIARQPGVQREGGRVRDACAGPGAASQCVHCRADRAGAGAGERRDAARAQLRGAAQPGLRLRDRGRDHDVAQPRRSALRRRRRIPELLRRSVGERRSGTGRRERRHDLAPAAFRRDQHECLGRGHAPSPERWRRPAR